MRSISVKSSTLMRTPSRTTRSIFFRWCVRTFCLPSLSGLCVGKTARDSAPIAVSTSPFPRVIAIIRSPIPVGLASRASKEYFLTTPCEFFPFSGYHYQAPTRAFAANTGRPRWPFPKRKSRNQRHVCVAPLTGVSLRRRVARALVAVQPSCLTLCVAPVVGTKAAWPFLSTDRHNSSCCQSLLTRWVATVHLAK